MGYEIRITDVLTEDCKFLRTTVFIEEQGFQNELDETDKRAFHACLYVDGKPAAVGRLFTDDGGVEYHIGRVAVAADQRGKQLGRAIMEALEEKARSLGGVRVALSAQCRAAEFYRKLGYTQVGEEYLDEYCPHIAMVKTL